MRWEAKWAARSVTDIRGGGKGVVLEQGETEREESLVAAVDEPIEGERGESKEKFSSNMVAVDRRSRQHRRLCRSKWKNESGVVSCHCNEDITSEEVVEAWVETFNQRSGPAHVIKQPRSSPMLPPRGAKRPTRERRRGRAGPRRQRQQLTRRKLKRRA